MAVVIWAKTKKTGQRGLLPYLSTTYTYLKLLNLVLWFYADPVKGIIYLVLATSESSRRDCLTLLLLSWGFREGYRPP